ncbi:hypothetical protein [Pseudanabaena sp. PCC 6802]|uniref:hypothetical protein n=1 Tax=Pseudanabaena sp. PCC 6802 TaxID=118173 RepID=UPI00034A0989|nr:hypothetical protein [Pseudanabaena sp. PCC 6802]
MELEQLSTLENPYRDRDIVSAVELAIALNATDSVEWLHVGQTMTPAPNPFSITSSGGIGATVRIPSGTFLRIDQTPSFPGAFDVGDALLFTGLANPGPLTITFDVPVFGAGTHIQSDPANTPNYIVTVEAFDRGDRSLGKFEFSGVSSKVAGSGVLFVGLLDRSGSIKKLVLNALEQGASVPFAINAIALRTSIT